MKTTAKQTVAACLRAWMTYAADHRQPGGSVLGLSRLSGVSRPTIADILAGHAAPAVDTLEKLASAYNLAAWQLLVPGCAPPTKPTLGDTAWIDAEIARRTHIEVASLVHEMAALYGDGRRDGRSPAKPFHLGPVETIESRGDRETDNNTTDREATSARTQSTAGTGRKKPKTA